MMKDFISKNRRYIIIGGIVLFAIGLLLASINTDKANRINEYDGENTGMVAVSGPMTIKGQAYDEVFDISVDDPVLIRNVEMVQWYKDEKGIRLVFANYPLESFEESGIRYENPEFPYYSEMFYGDTFIKDVRLDETYLDELLKKDLKLKDLKQLPEENGLRYGLICLDGAYVSASDEWQLGEIKVYYTYLDDKDIPELIYTGDLDENKNLTMDSELKPIYDAAASLEEIRKDNTADNTFNYILMIGGLAVICFSLLNKNKQ